MRSDLGGMPPLTPLPNQGRTEGKRDCYSMEVLEDALLQLSCWNQLLQK